MRLSLFVFISIVLLVFLIQDGQGQYWSGGSSMGQCYGRYERYSSCSSTCPDTCDDIRRPNPAKICTMMCRLGCECMLPFVRLNQNIMSPCVHPRQCRFIWY